MTPPRKRYHDPGKGTTTRDLESQENELYITPSKFDLVQVKFIRVHTNCEFKNDPIWYFQKIKNFPPNFFFRNEFGVENLFYFPIIFTPTNSIPLKWGKIFGKIWEILKLITLTFSVWSWWSFLFWNRHLFRQYCATNNSIPHVVLF